MVFWDTKSLQRITRLREKGITSEKLGHVLQKYVKKTLQPKWKKLTKVSQAWQEILPEELVEHSCLEKLQAGQLYVKVDNAAYLYELQLLIKGDLLEQLRQSCPGLSISRIKLERGIWLEGDKEKEERIDREL
jgi:hypothetical protein